MNANFYGRCLNYNNFWTVRPCSHYRYWGSGYLANSCQTQTIFCIEDGLGRWDPTISNFNNKNVSLNVHLYEYVYHV